MGIFEKLFGNRKLSEKASAETLQPQECPVEDWKEIPGYAEADRDESAFVSAIATAIASGDQPNSSFAVKKVSKRNPEAELIGILAACMASGEASGKHFAVKRILAKQAEELRKAP